MIRVPSDEIRDVFLEAISSYIGRSETLALYEVLGSDFWLLLSLMSGKTIRVPSISTLRSLMDSVEVHVKMVKILAEMSYIEAVDCTARLLKKTPSDVETRYKRIEKMFNKTPLEVAEG